jgi:hypothetical protein
MALQTSGAISLANIQTEFGGANPISISEYYGVGTVPASGTISLSHFYGQTARAPAGSQTFTASGTFTVPLGYTSVTICMCGGGGSGATTYSATKAGGGYAGQAVSQVVSVTSGASISITVGSGAARRVSGQASGIAGSASKFGAVTANGGAAGVFGGGYAGNGGALVSACGAGTFYHGTSREATYGTPFAYGGQASAFGNGGNAGLSNSGGAAAGGVGAGGGGCVDFIGSVAASGAGGRGQVRISWS